MKHSTHYLLILVLCSVTSPMYPRYVALFSHGLGGSPRQKRFIKPLLGSLVDDIHAFSYPDAEKNFRQTSLGQKDEIELLHSQIKSLCANDNQILLFGWSRGASVIINTLATMSEEEAQHITGIILQSPFDQMSTVTQAKLNQFRLGRIRNLKKIINLHLLPYCFKKYSPFAITPLQATKLLGSYHKQIPIFVVCSKEDTLVPAHSTISLFDALQEAGCHTKLITFAKGNHKDLHIINQKKYTALIYQWHQTYVVPFIMGKIGLISDSLATD